MHLELHVRYVAICARVPTNKGRSVVANIVVLMAVCHVKYIEKLGAFLSVAVSSIISDEMKSQVAER